MFYVWAFMERTSPEVQHQDKVGTFYLLFYSLFIDIFWCLFWGSKWDTVPNLAHELTVLFSWCGVIIKIIIFILISLLEFNSIKDSIFRLIKAKQPTKGFLPYNDEEHL